MLGIYNGVSAGAGLGGRAIQFRDKEAKELSEEQLRKDSLAKAAIYNELSQPSTTQVAADLTPLQDPVGTIALISEAIDLAGSSHTGCLAMWTGRQVQALSWDDTYSSKQAIKLSAGHRQ